MAIDDTVRYELLKLLLQVAWADHEVQPEERAVVHGYAEKLHPPLVSTEALDAYLDGRAPLPPPDLELLKQHREEAMFVAKSLVRADLQILAEEAALIEQLRDTLYERG